MRYFLVIAALLAWPAASQTTPQECLVCHDTVDAAKFAGSVHSPLGCTDCHADIKSAPHETPPKPVDCATCHTDAAAAWDHSLHAKKGPRCIDCHGPAHEILPSSDSKSRTFHANIPKTCERCHAQKFVMEKAGLSPQPAILYNESVHGRAIARGSTKAAVCTDCHDSHAVRAANDPQSGIFKFNVARTCGKCHAAIAAKFGDSVHGKALARGNWTSPVCTDCHGIHTITKSSDAVSGPRASCARCHESVRLTQEFSVAPDRVSTYQASYHGLARKMGSRVAADCASCHGAHDVLPSSDPRSAVHHANLQKTCGKCHQGAQANFTRGKIHVAEGETNDLPSRLNTWIRRIYVVLILGTVGFMLFHNLLIWWRKAQAARRSPHRTVQRMNLNQRIQHIIMIASFTILVISGFALAWPDSLLAKVFGPNEELRRWVHRVAAVIMMALGVYHLAYMVLTREGRKGLRDLWVRVSDARDVFAVLRHYLGFSKQKPTFGRFSYGEKIEYWAGMWGTIVMAITGLMIWFNVTVASWIPRWWIDIATTVHFYEAILATLAIIVWHLYHVVFDPDVYPMNWAWYDGKISTEQQEEEHGREVSEE